MARANAAYYAAHDPFADFTTAPEIGQVFGELLGAWAAVVWQAMGAPCPVLLVEAGPGRGTLMADALRVVTRVAPSFRAAARVHFVETSPRLRAIQARAVPDAAWHATLGDVPGGPTILLANEFLDALPVRQFERRGGAWFERYVDGGRLALVPCAGDHDVPEGAVLEMADAPEGAVLGMADAPEGAVLEINEAGVAWMRGLASRLVRWGGAALALDYGRDVAGLGDTLQALRGGRRADPLADAGEADLTAHVDFPALAAAAHAEGAAVHGPIAQGAFLEALGLRERTAMLATLHPARAASLRDAADRLAAPARMGQLFKAMALTAPGAPVPPGFSA